MTPAGPVAPIASVCWRPWRIPLRNPIATGAGDLAVREGLVVRIETADGAVGLGECAPLPGEGLTGTALEARMEHLGRDLRGTSPVEAWSSLPSPDSIPGADVAIEAALADLLARSCATPLAGWLAGQTGVPLPSPAPVPANALLGATSPEDLAREAESAVACGYRTVKVKVGPDPALDGERLRAVRSAIGPDVAIRIDANGSWGEEEALACLEGHAAQGIALCEQPVAPGPDAPARFGRVRVASTIPIAADESCASRDDVRALLDAGAVDGLVIKPLRTGLVEALGMIREATARNVPCILTTTFDTGVGTALALHLAALLREPRSACGLATLPLLAGDIVQGCPAPESGAVSLPAGPGLGVTLDEDALDRFATGPWQGVSA